MSSNDPRPELLAVLQASGDLESDVCAASGAVHSRRRRFSLLKLYASATLMVVALLAGALLVLSSQPPGPEPTDERLSRLFTATTMSDGDLEFLRSTLTDPSSERRRRALWSLDAARAHIATPLLESLLVAGPLVESIERPVEFASTRAATLDARTTTHAMTIRAVLSALRRQALLFGEHAWPRRIEPYLAHPDETVRIYAVKALRENPEYVPGGAVHAKLGADTDAVRRAARSLLDRTK